MQQFIQPQQMAYGGAPVMGQPMMGQQPMQQQFVQPAFAPQPQVVANPFLQPGNGFSYGALQPIKFTNPLPNVQERIKTGAGKRFDLTQEDLDQAICTHRDEHKSYLVNNHNPDDPSEVRCQICQAEFSLIENVTPEQVSSTIKDCIDIMQTAKSMYVNIPPELCVQMFQIIAVLKHMDKIWQIASDQFNKYVDPTANLGNIGNSGVGNVFAAYNNIIGQPQMMAPGYGYAAPQMPYPQAAPVMQPQQQAPVYAQPQQQPMVSIQPMAFTQPDGAQQGQMTYVNPQAAMMTAAAPGLAPSNGFGYTAAPTPENLTPGVNQGVQVQQPQQQAAAPEGAPVVTKQLQA